MPAKPSSTGSGGPAALRSVCPIAAALDLLGDRWTLLVVRDLLLFGKKRFGELLASPEKIPTNLLTDRLRRLEEAGIVTRVPYQEAPTRYEYRLTPRGVDIFPVLRALIEWGNRQVPETSQAKPGQLDEMEEALRQSLDRRGRLG
jgi:DNA-binding HxlR family transcriptional regulator